MNTDNNQNKQLTELSDEDLKQVNGGMTGYSKKKDDKGNCIETISESSIYVVDPGIGPI